MATNNPSRASEAELAAARKRAEQTRQALQQKPGPSELLTPEERADAAPFYLVLRQYIRQLKEAREAAKLTLAEVADRTGLAVETLSRLETGALTNPTWKTLGTYAAALGLRPRLTADAAGHDHDDRTVVRRPDDGTRRAERHAKQG
jgi:DNA-binding XRE family transcriptional regulator